MDFFFFLVSLHSRVRVRVRAYVVVEARKQPQVSFLRCHLSFGDRVLPWPGAHWEASLLATEP